MLPQTENTHYTPADPVKSVDLVDFQAQITGKKYPPIWRWENISRGWTETTIVPVIDGSGYDNGIKSNGANSLLAGIKVGGFDVGTEIIDFGFRMKGTGGASVNFGALEIVKDNAVSGGDFKRSVNTPPAAWATYKYSDVAGVFSHILADGENLVVTFFLAIANIEVCGFGIRTQRL